MSISNNEILPKTVLSSMLKSGLVISGIKGTGKSNVGKVFTSEIIRNQPLPIQVKIFDTASNLRWDFENINFQEITERTRYFYDGKEHILFDVALFDDADVMDFMEKVVRTDYLNQRLHKEQTGGYNEKWILYLVEEAQNIIGRYSLQSKKGKRLLKLFSEGRNFGLSFIFIGQRLADISTSAIERCNGFLFGTMIGDNDRTKLKRIVGKNSSIINNVTKLDIGKGEFIYFDGQSTYDIKCPRYDSKGQKPKLWSVDLEKIPMWKYVEGRKIV